MPDPCHTRDWDVVGPSTPDALAAAKAEIQVREVRAKRGIGRHSGSGGWRPCGNSVD